MTRPYTLCLIAVLFCLLSQGRPAVGQEVADPVIIKVFRLQHISTGNAQGLISPILGNSDVKFTPIHDLKLLSVQAPTSRIEQIERILQEYDVPEPTGATPQRQDVVVTGYFLGAADSEADAPPQIVADTVQELRRHFPYKSYVLLETFSVRTRVGGVPKLGGLMTTEPELPPSRYDLSLRLDEVIGRRAGQRVVVITGLEGGWRIPIRGDDERYYFETPSIASSLDIPEGATVVVGKTGAAGTYRGIFLLLRADIVDL